MPLLFRKRGLRSSRAACSEGALHNLAGPAVVVETAPTNHVHTLSPQAGHGVSLVAVWDLPGLNANGDYLDENDGQPPLKVKIQERTEFAGILNPLSPESGEHSQEAQRIEADDDGNTNTNIEIGCGEETRTSDRVRQLEERVLELERAERAAQEAVLNLRREVMRLELEIDCRLSEEKQLKAALEALQLDAERMRDEELRYKEVIESLREKVANLEEQQYQQYQQQQYHQHHLEHKLDILPGYMMEEMVHPFSMYTPPGLGPTPTDYCYPMHPGALEPPQQPPQQEDHPSQLEHQQDEEEHEEPQQPDIQLQQLQQQHMQQQQHQHLHHQQLQQQLQHQQLQQQQLQHQQLQQSQLVLPPVQVQPQAPNSRSRRKARQCYNCQKFGHTSVQCPSETICLVCSELGHSHKNCNSDHIKCVNCSGQHRASYKNCPARLEWDSKNASPRA